MNKTYTLTQLKDLFFHPSYEYAKIENPNCEISSIKFYSPIEKVLSENTLYVASLNTWHQKPIACDKKISVIIFGDYNGEFDWCNNIFVFHDTPEKRRCVEKIQREFLPEICKYKQVDALTHAMIQNKGLDDLVEQASYILNNPLVVFHGDMHRCSASLGSFTRTWREEGLNTVEIQKKQDYILSNISEYLQHIYEMYQKTGRYYEKFTYLKKIHCHLLIHAIQVNNFDIAILVILEKDINQLDMDIEVIQVLIGLLAQELQKTIYYIDNHGDAKASFLINLLNDLHPSEKLIQQRLRVLSYKMKEKMYVLVIRFSKRHTQDVNMLLFQFQRLLTGELYAIYQNQLVIVLNREKNQSIGEYLLKNLQEIAGRFHLLVGISQEFFDILEIRRYFHQAVKALDYGEVMLRKNSKHPLYYFQDYTLLEMLEICRKNEPLLDFCNPKLLWLLRYDEEMHTDYMTTLFEYIENCLNIKRTADALYIHKNTLIYRLEKIKPILKYDFTDSWENFTLYLSFRILMFTGTYSPEWREKKEKEFQEN